MTDAAIGYVCACLLVETTTLGKLWGDTSLALTMNSGMPGQHRVVLFERRQSSRECTYLPHQLSVHSCRGGLRITVTLFLSMTLWLS